MNGINNNISFKNQTVSQNSLRERNLFNSLELESTSKQIDPPKGKLLPNYNPVTGIMVGTINTGKDIGKFVKAIATGKSDDNSLGRMNDIGLKLGGAGIAAYLATKRVTSTTKGMEFVGFGAFVAAMALWPKVFINFPMFIKNGFHIDQRYRDSNGKEKPFFLDNQYLAWDLWSKKDIDKIADKQHFDKDIKDREELTKKWMQKTALQGRTLATLTAGAGVPLVTAMACSQAEKWLTNMNIDRAMKSATKDLENIGSFVPKKLDKVTAKAIKAILAEYKTKPVDDAFYLKMGDLLNPLSVIRSAADGDSLRIVEGLNYNKYVEAAAKELKDKCTINPGKKSAGDVAENLITALGEKLKIRKGISIKTAATTAITPDQLKGLLGDKKLDAQSVLEILKSNNVSVEGGDLKAAVEGAFGIGTKSMDDIAKEVAEYAKISRSRLPLFERFVNALAGNRAESVFTRGYNDISSSFMKQMNPTRKQMKGFFRAAAKTGDTQTAEDFVMQQMKEIVSRGKEGGSKSGMQYFLESINGGLLKMNKLGQNGKDQMEAFTAALPHLGDPKAAEALSNFIKISRLDKESSAMRLVAALDLENKLNDKDVVKKYGQEVIETARKIIYKATTVSSADPALSSGGNPETYSKALDLLFGGDIDKNLQEMMNEQAGKLCEAYSKFRTNVKDLIGSGNIDTKEGAANLGEPIIDMFKKGCKQQYNNKTWMKIFGTATLAIIGVTLLAQFFIGKSKKEEELYKKDKGAQDAK